MNFIPKLQVFGIFFDAFRKYQIGGAPLPTKRKYVSRLLGSAILFAIGYVGVVSQELRQEDSALPFGMKIVKQGTRDISGTRQVFILLDEKFFEEKKLASIFGQIGKSYDADVDIEATISISDECISYEIKAKPANAEIVLPGCLVAVYRRNRHWESFIYTHHRGNGDMIERTFRNDLTNINLIEAIKIGYSWKISALLIAGADVNSKDNTQTTALIWAVLGFQNNLAKRLIDAGATVDALDDKRLTALSYGSFVGNSEAVKILVKSGANVNVADSEGLTPLMMAADSKEVVNTLIESGASIEARDKNGWTPLFYAIAKGQVTKISTLLSKGADKRAKNNLQVDAFAFLEQQRLSDELKGTISNLLNLH